MCVKARLLRLCLVIVASLATSHCRAQPMEDTVALQEEENGSGFDGPLISDSGVGYIDNAILGDQLRFRFDAAYNNVQPARAEFFWPVNGPFGPGPGPETRADYQDFSVYYEHLTTSRLSIFGELPVRLLNPELQDNTGGIGDANVGFKYLLNSCCDRVATFQLRTYIPTADGTRGLGTRHVSLEPALLLYQRYSERVTLEGEVRDWISIGGTDGFAGNVLRYGIGAGYLIDPCACRPLTAVVEFVGWTVLEGGTAITTSPTVTIFADATGDTIVNAKAGVRYGLSPLTSLYAGYGRALTEQTWYDDVIRFELRREF